MPQGRKEIVMTTDYKNRKRNCIEIFYRFSFGVQELVKRPYYNIFLLVEIFIFLFAWNFKTKIFPYDIFPSIIYSYFMYVLSALFIFVFILSIFATIVEIGFITSKKDESALQNAFSRESLRNGCPILITRKKNHEVTIKEFYSNIPKSEWVKHMDSIADSMNCHFVQPEIEYGGRKSNHGKHIRIYTAPGRTRKKRGNMYADDL